MDACFEYRLSREEYVVGLQVLQAELARQDKGAGRRIFERLLIGVPPMLLVMLLFPEAFAGLLVAALLITLLEAALRGRWLSGATGQSYDPAAAELKVAISEEGLSETSPGRRRDFSWTAVRRVHESDCAIVAELVGWDMVVLPSRLWADEADRAAFVERIRERLPAAAAPAAPAPPPQAAEILLIGSIAVAVDLLFLLCDPLVALTGDPGALAGRIGFAAAMGLVLLAFAAIAWPAYRLARAGLVRLHAAHPAAALAFAHAAIWALPLYMLAAYAGLL